MKSVRLLLALGSAAAIVACVPRTPAPPPPQAEPVRPVTPRPPPPPPAPAEWSLLPLTPGSWLYRNDGNGSQALFGPGGGQASFIVRCDRVQNRVTLTRTGASSATAMTVRTSFGARNFPVTTQTQPTAGISTALPASDRTLDSMAFSRGRFTVEAQGLPMLVIPAWPEPARVVEDCRG